MPTKVSADRHTFPIIPILPPFAFSRVYCFLSGLSGDHDMIGMGEGYHHGEVVTEGSRPWCMVVRKGCCGAMLPQVHLVHVHTASQSYRIYLCSLFTMETIFTTGQIHGTV